jgi:NADH:ubiquinone oxidoreductase subunit F (NADH-binding)
MIPEHQFDTPCSFEHLQKLGSMMGSGGMIVIDDHDSVVELARFYLDFLVDESCGKCAPCRIGGTQMLHLLDRFVEGKGRPDDIKKIRTIANAMHKASLCAGAHPIRRSPHCATLNRSFSKGSRQHRPNRF